MSISPFEDDRDYEALPVWTEDDQQQALARGWGVFQDADRGPEIQRFDDADIFGSDQAACRHVRECQGTSHLCRKAMLFLGVAQREWHDNARLAA